MRIAIPVVAVLATIVFGIALRGQAPQRTTPPILIDSLVGIDLFVAYCAPCHGRSGRGDGPVAAALKIPPANLSTLARRNGGRYSSALVEGRLAGTQGPSDSAAHGTTAMPIWGPIFQQLDQKDSVARVRVENLVRYVETVQVQ